MDNNALARALLERGAFPGKYASTNTLGAESSDNKRPLWFGDGPMVWIDCEMTGLNPKKDRLLEIAVLITDGNLDIVDEEGISFTIKTDKEHLDNMDEWCVRQHGESGLTAACLESPYDLACLAKYFAYVQRWVPKQGTAVLAGSSVHFDKVFLSLYMPELIKHLHYRIVDVSTIKELCRRWFPLASQQRTNGPPIVTKHRSVSLLCLSISCVYHLALRRLP
ncbi:hypothetical protein BS47DRAFT_1326016 [Hydnum rufescens UP504]|uniref:Exonuclease domain-containing protein n=1 Tax=Hydnum rufescens UP504 TaxID=1448309 RepID=A0A9P6B5D9_9AGAM|nr:hypothetical protein BS47DRAFT_1326016 [Hydnum rufescens UP504]